jgi:stress response protein SCP2
MSDSFIYIQKLKVNDEEIIYLGEFENDQKMFTVFLSVDNPEVPTIDFVASEYGDTIPTQKSITFNQLIELFISAYNNEKAYTAKSLSFQLAFNTAEQVIVDVILHAMRYLSFPEQALFYQQCIIQGLDFEVIRQLQYEATQAAQAFQV